MCKGEWVANDLEDTNNMMWWLLSRLKCGCIISHIMGGICVYFYIILLFTQYNMWLIDVSKTMDIFYKHKHKTLF